MHNEYRELMTPPIMGAATGITCTFAVLFAILGPLDTHQTLDWLVRLYFSGLIFVLDLVICYGAFLLMLYLMRARTTWQSALSLVPFALIMSAPCTAIAYTVHHLAEPGRIQIETLPPIYLVCAVTLMGSSAMLYYVLHLQVRRRRTTGDSVSPSPAADHHDDATDGNAVRLMTARVGTVGARSAVTEEAGKAVDSESADQNRLEPQGRFLRRMPISVSHDIIYLKASGHYVEVITGAGSVIILMRLVDAAAELGSHGMRIHRSYWAARGHITGLLRRGRRMLLCLTGGHELPISRSYLTDVRKAVAERDIE